MYERVYAVELHSAPVIVTTKEGCGKAGWSEFWNARERYHLSADAPNATLGRFLDADLVVERETQVVGAGGRGWPNAQEYDWIEVAVPVVPGFLDIRAGYSWDERDEKKTAIDHVTYSGNYTIWWTDDRA